MSDSPGSNPRPRNNRGGRNRNRNNNDNRGPRRDHDRRDRRREDHPGGRRDDRRKNDERRDFRPERRPPPTAPKPTVWQKVLTILTFGLVRPKTASGRPPRPDAKPKKPQSPKEGQQASREPRQQTAPPATDPESVDTDRLHIGNLSYDATENDLLDLFKGIGKVQNVDIVYNGRTHRSKGFGFVQMMSVADARRAVAELHGKTFMGRPLHLGPARSRGRDEREADDEQE